MFTIEVVSLNFAMLRCVPVLLLLINGHPREGVFFLLQGVLTLEPLVLLIGVFLFVFLTSLLFFEVELKSNILIKIDFFVAD